MQTLADIPALTPGDLPPPPPLEDHAVVRERWPVWLKADFKRMAPAAVWIGGARDLVSASVYHADGTVTRFGHNRLARPVKVGMSEAWKDTVTTRLDQVPFWWQGLLVRLWVRSDDHAKILMGAVVDHLALLADGLGLDLRREFVDLGPDVAIDRLGSDLRALADRLNMDSWDDDDLVAHLTRAHEKQMEAERKAAQARATWKGGR